MFRILLLIIIGIGAGYLLRNSTAIVRGIEKSTRYTIFLMLFILGVSTGSNRTVIDNIAGVGLEAVVITGLGIIGSIVVTSLCKHFLSKRKGGEK